MNGGKFVGTGNKVGDDDKFFFTQFFYRFCDRGEII
jgi:hypothetical protein